MIVLTQFKSAPERWRRRQNMEGNSNQQWQEAGVKIEETENHARCWQIYWKYVLLSAMFLNINWYITVLVPRRNCVYVSVSLGHAQQEINHFKDKNSLKKIAQPPDVPYATWYRLANDTEHTLKIYITWCVIYLNFFLKPGTLYVRFELSKSHMIRQYTVSEKKIEC